ncbi:MAG: HepT-like ribonuclease domain-containing protein [Candidatus Aenigmatarchaeota archaeon]
MERIAQAIADIEKWFKELKKLDIKRLENLDDSRNFYTASMLIFSIINRTIDIGEELIAIKRLGFPSSYREIFEILEKNRVIDEELMKKLSRLVFYRNLFAHEYFSFSKKDVFNTLQMIKNEKILKGI